MNVSDIEKELKKIVALEFKINESQLSRDSRFLEDLFARSIQIVEMCALMEIKFGIEVPLSEVRENKTIGQAIDYIADKIKRQGNLVVRE